MNKKILLLILSLIIILPSPAFAAAFNCVADPNAILCVMINSAVNLALYVAYAAVIILWVVTGLLFLAAQGSPEKLNSAKKTLFLAVIGTVIVIVAQYAMDLVGQAFGI